MRITNSRILPFALLAASLFVVAQPANAHDSRYDRYQRYEHAPLHANQHRAPLPYWLRSNYDFVRWYDLNRYGFGIDISWKRVYYDYERDHRYHRKYQARKKAYRDDRRRYDKKRKSRNKRHH